MMHSYDAALKRLRLRAWQHSGTGMPIVLLPPNQMVARIWAEMIKASKLDNPFITPDQRGHGDSDYPEDGYTLNDYAADAFELMEHLGLERVVLVGAATGANISLLMASQQPERFAGLVVINPALNISPEKKEQLKAAMMERQHFASFEEAAAALPHSGRWSDAARTAYAQAAFRQTTLGYEWRCSLKAVAATYDAVAVPIWDQLNVRCPTLIVRAEESPVFSAADQEQLQRVIPDATCETLADAGQLVMQDQPVTLAGLLDDFVQSHNL